MSRILTWIDDRTGVRAFTRAALYEHIPGGSRWRYVWGSTLVFAFVVQLVTGFVLWMNYSPSGTTAWESVYYIQHVMPAGDWLRGVHHFTAQAMIVLLALHMMQVVIDGAYRAPREFNWWIGLALLLLTLGLGLTGYLLPWDQRGYWSTKVATNIMSTVPVVGPSLQRLAIGGTEYGHHTLTRFFALHAGLLPLLMIGLIGLHVYLFRRHGITVKQPKRGKDATFWVDQVLKDAVACLAVLATVLFLVVWPKLTGKGHYGAELSAPADPSTAFSAARPEWYFLSLFQALKYFPGSREVVGAVVVPGVVFFVFVLMPFIGRARVGHWFNVFFTLSMLTGVVLLTTMAVIQDTGRPQWGVPVVGGFGTGFGVVLTALVALAILVLFGLSLRRGTARGYFRGLVALGGVLLAVGLLILWALAPGGRRLGSQEWSIGGYVVPPQWQLWLLFGLLGLAALLLTAGVVREPYSTAEVAAGEGFPHRWQWLHRGRLMLLALLVFAVAALTAVTLIGTPAGDPTYQQGLADAREAAERVVVLAGSPDGIPPGGAAALLRNDPKTQGPRLFARNCAGCHRYDGHDGLGRKPDEKTSPETASDLKGFASREWLAGLLDPDRVATPHYFGGTPKFRTGEMAKFVQNRVGKYTPEQRQLLVKALAAVSAEAQLPGQQAADARDADVIRQGREIIKARTSDIRCTKCHEFREPNEEADAPLLTGYGSRAWLVNFIRNPGHDRYYGSRNAMPAYGEKMILDDESIGIIADWLRGDWYEPGRPPPARPAVTVAMAPAGPGTAQGMPGTTAKTAAPATRDAAATPSTPPRTAPATAPAPAEPPRPPEPTPPEPPKPEPTASPATPPPATGPATEPAAPTTTAPARPATAPTTAPATAPAAPEKPAPGEGTPEPPSAEKPDAGMSKPTPESTPEPPPPPHKAAPSPPGADDKGPEKSVTDDATHPPVPPATTPASRPSTAPAAPAGESSRATPPDLAAVSTPGVAVLAAATVPSAPAARTPAVLALPGRVPRADRG